MKKLIINNGKALADSTGKVLAIESDVTITSKGGWQGTPVPNSGYVENVYFNTNLSVEEVVSLLTQLTFNMPDGSYYVCLLTDESKIINIVKNGDTFGIINLIDGFEPIFTNGTEFEWEFVGFNPNFDGIIEVNSDVVSTTVMDEVTYEVGLDNAQLSTLFSTTPFVQASGESIGLSGEYDGSSIEVSESVDMKALIDEKKIPLLINVKGGNSVIEVEEFPTENVQDLTFYKRKVKTNTEVYVFADGVLTNVSPMFSIIYECNEYPTNMITSNLDTNEVYLYIYNGICYLSTDLGDGLQDITLGNLFGSEDKGSIESKEQITENGIYVVYGKEIDLFGVNNETYNFIDGVWNNYADILVKLIENDYSLNHLNLPKCTVIRTSCFSGMDGIITAKFANVGAIWTSAFSGCQSLTDLYLGYNGVVTLINTNHFDFCPNTKVHVRAEYLSDYEADTVWAEAISKGYITLVGDYTD